MPALPHELKRDIQRTLNIEVHDDLVSRILFSTDASIYQIPPLGVVFPRTLDDLSALVSLAVRYKVPIIARGSGSGIAGQAIGEGLIIDTTRHLTRIHQINPQEMTATLEPGVLLTTFNRAAAQYGLTFAPDPASADRASFGGSIGNNASGAHSILYGMAVDHLISAEVILADGTQTVFEEITLSEARRRAASSPASLESVIYKTALDIREHGAQTIRKGFPLVWRRASGYNLNYLLPWSQTRPPQWDTYNTLPYPPVNDGYLNLAAMLAGSEGTLAVIKTMKIRLVPQLKHTVLAVLSFDSIAAACDATPGLLAHDPSAIELIPGDLIRLARSVPAYARQLTFVHGQPAALLVVEFSGSDTAQLKTRAQRLGKDVLIAETTAQQNQVWGVRKVGLGIFNSLPGDAKPYAVIEDMAVPVERLGEFVRQIERIVAEYGTHANIYAHASAGCLHIRPLISIKDAAGVANMRAIAEKAVALVIELNGAVSGEHGDGLARSEWIERAYGTDIYRLFKAFKQAADPQNLLNPGKIIDAPPMDQSLRYGEGYKTHAWQPVMDFSSQVDIPGAIEMCNGAGVCRKDTGLMCPSFQALQDEMHSPRGRSNLLRAMISGKFPLEKIAEDAIYQALDLCLSCKGCKSECPSAVDVAKLKFEFLNRYYQTHPRKLRDHLFANIDWLALLGGPFAPLLNALLGNRLVRAVNERLLKLSKERQFPQFATVARKRNITAHKTVGAYDVLFLNDSFSRDFHPETAIAGLQVLRQVGCSPRLLPVVGAGRPLISKGFLDRARAHAAHLVATIRALDPQGLIPVVGVEPSEIYALRDEYPDFFPADPYVAALAKRAWMVDEFIIRPGQSGKPRLQSLRCTEILAHKGTSVLLHGQCTQKVQPPADDGYPVGAQATIVMLEAAGYHVEMIESGCCGMAGAFGYEAEHYPLSMKIGEMAVFPAVRKVAENVIVAASGTSCRSQIKSGTARQAVHPITLL